MKKFTLAAVCLLCLAGCQNDNKKAGWSKARTEMEAQAQVCLKDARAALERADYTTARAKVEEIRSQYNLALNAREEAILFMDSVDMRQATQELQRVNQLIHTQPENQILPAEAGTRQEEPAGTLIPARPERPAPRISYP